MKALLIAGIGSPFGADQLGWQVVDDLQKSAAATLQHCTFLKLDRPGAGLIERLQGYARVILIDALQAGRPRGTLVRLDAEQISEQAAGLSSHNFGVAEAVALGRVMGQLPQELVLYGLDAGEKPDMAFETGETEQLVARVVHELSERERDQIISSPER
ncbi:hydrogenase maturation protease [Thiohalophilus thiocyanatoxydans]|uniref:Hydrogenase maturation protease n=1 Tax=Thiohalophilus thiocyanatoxydans TaxID=381308 RepID=A0A4R8IXA8_9GAMM|nr:hydrogenase maturation protease [Thiohalophilus thiocyanatoxydans]TDY04200.1 hydrogenase maturation protease [Thiohalophilus thiocyanatoxydans]